MTAPELASYWSSNDNDGRAYKHPYRMGEDGKPITSPSVTTVLKEAPKDLSQYAADQTAKWAAENWSMLGERSDEKAFNLARYRWKDNTNERAEVGTGIHETIEAEHRGLWTFPELGEEQQMIMDQWRLFNDEYEVHPLRSEFTVWNFTHDYAGTTDGLWWITDRHTGERALYLVDIKTSKKTWDTHWMQGAALLNGEVIMEKVQDSWVEVEPRALHDWDQVKFAVVHLRADHHDLVTVSDAEMKLRYDQFLSYRKLWTLRRDISTLQKNETNGSF